MSGVAAVEQKLIPACAVGWCHCRVMPGFRIIATIARIAAQRSLRSYGNQALRRLRRYGREFDWLYERK